MRAPSTTTAPPWSTPASLISAPRRARGGPAQVTTWVALTKRSVTPLSRHHVAHARQPHRCFRFTAAGVEAGVARDRLVLLELGPVEIRRKIRATLHVARGIHVDRPDPRPAGLLQLPAGVPRN